MKKLLVPIDFSDVTNLVVENAKLIAKSIDAELKIIHVIAPLEEMNAQNAGNIGIGGVFVEPVTYGNIRDGLAKELKNEHKMMLEIKQKLMDEGLKVKTSLLEGKVAGTILSQIEEYCPDIIIAGSHGHGLVKKALLGSITMMMLKHVKCPIMIVPSGIKQK